MKREKVFLIDLSEIGFRRGEPAQIIGLSMITPEGLNPRLCYHLEWSDGVQDFKPVDQGNYNILTFNEVLVLNILKKQVSEQE